MERFVDSFCGQILADRIYTLEEISDKLWTDLLTLVDRICGQILVINSGQILWTNLYTFV